MEDAVIFGVPGLADQSYKGDSAGACADASEGNGAGTCAGASAGAGRRASVSESATAVMCAPLA